VHFCLPFYYSFILVITSHYHFNHALAKYEPYVCSTLLLKPASQKEKMDWNSSTKSYRLHVAPVAINVGLWSRFLFRFIECRHSL
jgi:hypothetical protein